MRDGQWRLLDCTPAWGGNWTSDCFLVFLWQDAADRCVLTVVNFAGNQSQCYVPLPLPDLAGHTMRLKDLMSPVCYDRAGEDLLSHGLYLDLPAWGYHVFELSLRMREPAISPT